jgi:hypothetical protein
MNRRDCGLDKSISSGDISSVPSIERLRDGIRFLMRGISDDPPTTAKSMQRRDFFETAIPDRMRRLTGLENAVVAEGACHTAKAQKAKLWMSSESRFPAAVPS